MTTPRSHAPGRPVEVHRLGLIDYERALGWQEERAASVRAGGREAVALLEHLPVYTLGARGDRSHLLADVAALEARGAKVVKTDRGGDVTFHGLGQLVVYPVLDLRARGVHVGDYVRCLEQVAIETAATFRVESRRVEGRPGAWVRVDAKLVAVGVRVRGGVSTHGLALNVSTDLSWFDAIVPCGIEGTGATSLERELAAASDPPHPNPLPLRERGPDFAGVGSERSHSAHSEPVEGCPSMREVEDALIHAFARVFDVAVIEEREAVGAR